MRAIGSNAPSVEPWMGAAGPGGTINAIVPPVNVKSGAVRVADDPEHDGATIPFERLDVSSLPPLGEDREADAAAPAPLSEASSSRSISSAVRSLTRIAKYELTELIGRGSFGVVYTARDTELDREVALKILNPSHHGDGDALHRFLCEARAAARISHPGIVTVHDYGRHATDDGDELAYIAMERLSGESLTQRLDRVGAMRPAAAAEVARQVASALDAAHRADVLHRDLKPDNVYLVSDPAVPSGERVKVLDFGLAKLGASRHTQTGSVFGTPLYMSPEQCRSSGSIDARSDIYSLGCILFELLTGSAPFEGAIFEVIERHLNEGAPRVSSLVPGISPALDVLVTAMLEKDPDDRPPTMAEVVQRLEEVIAAALEREGAPRTSAPAVAPRPSQAPIRASEAPTRASEAPLQLDDADRAALDAIAKVGPRFATHERPRRTQRRPLALLAAITLALGLAGALSLMASYRRGGDEAAPTAPSSIR